MYNFKSEQFKSINIFDLIRNLNFASLYNYKISNRK